MSELLQRAAERVQDSMDDILSNFKAGAKITVLVRTPGKPTADFCMTSDDLNEVAAMVKRRQDADPAPAANVTVIETRNDEAGFVEFVNEDRPYVVRDIPAPAAILLDMETRQVIGYRVYDPATAPIPNVATRLVIVESPYAGDVEANISYARAALRDCLDRGEAPYASHLLYTQPGILDDTDANQRKQGIEAGLAWGKLASATVVYTDRGISTGMQQGIDRAKAEGRAVEYRSIEKEAAA